MSILEVKNLNVYYTDKGSFFHGKKEEKKKSVGLQ